MRGLKQTFHLRLTSPSSVASFTDAWIETGDVTRWHFGGLSHLLQMRGLKPGSVTADIPVAMSHLLQMRGLKRSRTEAKKIYASRIFYRCVD